MSNKHELISNFVALDGDAFTQLMRSLGFVDAACYRLQGQELTFLIGSECDSQAAWPAKLSYDPSYYTHKNAERLPLGYVKPKFPAPLKKSLPNRTMAYFPEQELWHTKLVLLVSSHAGARYVAGDLDGYLEAILRRMSNWVDAGELRHFINEAAFNEQMRQNQLDTQALIDHEIRTPLSVIEGYGQLIESWKDKVPEAREFSDLIVVQVDMAVRAVEKLTMALRTSFQNASDDNAVSRIKVVEIIRNIVDDIGTDLFVDVLPNKNVSIDIVVPEEAGSFVVSGVSKLLESALLEVLRNAVLYSGKGRISIACYQSEQSVVIDVEDDGNGVPVGSEDLIFLRFFQANMSGKKGVYRGLGLGLSIARQITEQHGGQLLYVRKGKENRGLFRFILPLVIENQRETQEGAA